jgi:methylmalonyl-CoA mutase N-terminal domain/subunit
VEAWTGELVGRARTLIQKVDELGGSVAAIENGFLAREIEESAYAAQREIEDGRRLVVGVNAFREADDSAPPVLTVDPQIEKEQVERLRAFRSVRNASAANSALQKLSSDARENRNLMPGILASVTVGATLGEVVQSLKTVFGEYRPGG